MESGFVRMELKYCERCGALWLRLEGSDVVFCGRCAKALAESSGWAESNHEPAMSVCNDSQSVFWVEGGHA